jgi:hypothetical protein
VAAISADEFSTAPNLLLVIPNASSLPRQTLPALFWTVACHVSCLLSIKRPVLSRFSDIGTKKDAQTGQGTVEGGSGRAREYASWRLS